MKTKKIKKTKKQQCNINDVIIAKRKSCPTCGCDTLITLSGITYLCDGIQSVYSCLTCNELMTSFKEVFFDDTVDMFNMYCVSDQLSRGQTPDDLLFNLKRVKSL